MRFLRGCIGRICFTGTSCQKNDEENLKSRFFSVYQGTLKTLAVDYTALIGGGGAKFPDP
jgi:hypothetical protein